MSNPSNTPYAVVWDMDGVLVDSGAAHRAAWETLAAELGHPFTDDDFLRTFGLANPDIFRVLWDTTGPPERLAAWAERKEALFRQHAPILHPLPGAPELVRALKAAGWRQAIGSSTPRINITLLLQVLGLEGLFDAIVCGDDLDRGKPDPQVFTLALQALSVPPRRGVVVEDAVAGVQAGKAAGAFTIGLTTTRPAADLWAAGADLVVERLDELTPAELTARLESRP